VSIVILHKKNLSRRRLLAKARQYADQHGERLLLIMADPTWEPMYFDRTATADTTSIADATRALKQLAVDEREPIRGIITLSEFCVPIVAALAAEFGLPGLGQDTAYAARDKLRMRRAFAKSGDVPQPRFELAHTAAGARRIAQEFGYPAIIKPIIGCHSMFVHKVSTEADVDQVFDEAQRGAWDGFAFDPLHAELRDQYAGGVLVEQFVPGPEISVESLVIDGVTHSLAIHDKPLPQGSTFEEIYASTPTRLPADTVTEVLAATARVHAALGIDTGATHVEFRLRDGREPVVLEAGARMGGGPIYRSVLLSTGVDMLEAVLDLATGRRPQIAPHGAPVPIGFRNIFPEQGGRVVGVVGVDEANGQQHVHEVEVFRKVGEFADVPPNTYEGHGHVIFTAPTLDELDRRFAELTRTLRIETDGRRPAEAAGHA